MPKEPDHPLYIIVLDHHRTASSGSQFILLLPSTHWLSCSPISFPIKHSFYGGCLFGTRLPRGRFVYHPCSYRTIHGRGGIGATSVRRRRARRRRSHTRDYSYICIPLLQSSVYQSSNWMTPHVNCFFLRKSARAAHRNTPRPHPTPPRDLGWGCGALGAF